MAALAENLRGAMAYTHRGRIWTTPLGAWEPTDHGPGDYARWHPGGEHLAIYRDGRIELLAVASGERRELARGAWKRDGSAVEIGGERVYFLREGDERLWTAPLAGGEARALDVKPGFTGELVVDRRERLLAGRAGKALWLVDLGSGRAEKYAKGCSPGISPDARWTMNNVGGHRAIQLHPVGDGKTRRVGADALTPDSKWDNHHWSNHPGYIAAQGDKGPNESYLVRLADGAAWRTTWCGETAYPDCWIAGDDGGDGDTPGLGGTHDGDGWHPPESGLVWIWERDDADNLAPSGGHAAAVVTEGTARIDRHRELLLPRGGWAHARLGDAVGEIGEDWSLHLAVHRCDPGVLLRLRGSDGEVLLWLRRTGSRLVAGPSGRRLGRAFEDRGAMSLVLVRDRDRLTAFADGRSLARIDLDPELGSAATVEIGATEDGAPGRFARLAIWNRALGGGEIDALADGWHAVVESRTPAPRIRVRAELADPAPIPTPDDLDDYRSGLAVHAWRVVEILDGELEAEEIAVADWAVLNRRATAAREGWEKGATATMALEPWGAHPELGSAWRSDAPESRALPLWYRVPDPAPATRSTGKATQ